VTAGLVQRDLERSSRAREHVETQAQEHLSLMGKISTEAQTLRQVKREKNLLQFNSAGNTVPVGLNDTKV